VAQRMAGIGRQRVSDAAGGRAPSSIATARNIVSFCSCAAEAIVVTSRDLA
jgi:hypothetical protein